MGKVIVGIIMMVICLIVFVCMAIGGCNAHYGYIRQIENYWTLADRSSTIEAKSDYIDKFVEAIEKSNMAEYNAILLPTPENSLKNNLDALKTLRDRLHQIKTMNPSSFEYNQAIQQITAQEQGEAKELLLNIDGCWTKANYLYLWDWVGVCLFVFGLLVGIFGGMSVILGSEEL